MDAATKLERAQRFLEEGRPAMALAALPKSTGPLAAETAFLRAEALRSQGYFSQAAAIYEALLRRSASLDQALSADAALGVASVYRSLGQVGKARAWLSKAAHDERRVLEDALIDRAAGKWKICLAKLGRLLSSAKAARDWGQAAFLLWATGGARRFSGDLAGSESDFQRSLALAKRAGDASGQAYALFGLGGVTRIRGRLKDAEGFYREARALLARTDDVFGKAYAECGYANVLRQQGRLSEAHAHYVKAHRLYSSLGDAVDLAYVDWGLGKIALQRGELKQAARRFKLALKGFEPDEHRGASLSRLELSRVLHALGKTNQAEKLFDDGVRQSRRAGLHAHLESFT